MSGFRWKTILICIVVFFLSVLAVGSYIEKKKERYNYQLTKAQSTLQQRCKGLYPIHLKGLEEEEIRSHPDFKQYKRCLEETSKEIVTE